MGDEEVCEEVVVVLNEVEMFSLLDVSDERMICCSEDYVFYAVVS